MARPPIIRPLLAAIVLLLAIGIDLAERATEAVPYATGDLAAGAALDQASLEWRQVPTGLLDGADPAAGGVVQHEIRRGDPILASNVGRHPPIPADWWSLPLDLPDGLFVGQPIRLVDAEGTFSTEGVVAAPAGDGGLGLRLPGLVAVAPAAADTIASLSASGSLIVLYGN